MSTEKILGKIKKCLRLSKSSNSNEAVTALRQAQALMEKYNINQEQVDLSSVKSAVISAGKAQKPPRFHQALVQTIKDAFGVEAIYQYGGLFNHGMNIKFIGIDAKPEIAEFAYIVLYRQLKKDRAEYMKTLKRYKRANKTRKADLFAEAWVMAIWNKVVKFTQPEEHTALIKQYMAGKHKDLETMKSKKHKVKSNDDDAFSAGHQAGSAARLNHPMNGTEQKRLSGGA